MAPMNGSPRKIEIFAPFSAAMDLTKLILFQPFDLTKWLVIGFAAFLANLAGGGGGGFNFGRRFPSGANWNYRSVSHDMVDTSNGMPGWLVPVGIIVVLVVIALGLVLLWVGCRGRFIFADCVVRNRAAIVEPWHEFRREGNSLFVFSALVGLGMLVVLSLAGIPLWVPWLMHGDLPEGAGLVGGVALLGLVTFVVIIAWVLIGGFMLPVMYRRRCNAAEGFRGAVEIVTSEPGPVILFLLFNVVLRIGFAMIACVLTCVTCCITAIPYVGTVILLPFQVFFMAYLLLFVRQFGPEYDPWANVVAASPASATIEPPAAAAPPTPPEQPPFQT